MKEPESHLSGLGCTMVENYTYCESDTSIFYYFIILIALFFKNFGYPTTRQGRKVTEATSVCIISALYLPLHHADTVGILSISKTFLVMPRNASLLFWCDLFQSDAGHETLPNSAWPWQIPSGCQRGEWLPLLLHHFSTVILDISNFTCKYIFAHLRMYPTYPTQSNVLCDNHIPWRRIHLLYVSYTLEAFAVAPKWQTNE